MKMFLRLMFVAIGAVGALFVYFELHEIYDFLIKYLPSDNYVRWGVVVAAVAIGVVGFVFSFRGRTRASRKIEFQSKHGYIVIELDSVQKSLQKAMSKLPEVKDISLKVLPSDNDRKVRIVADAVVNKPPGAGIRETASNLEDKLAASAKRMLGVDDIASLDLNISRVLMNVKKEFDTSVDDNRLLEHQAAPAAAPVTQAPASVATAPAPASAPVADPPKSEAGLESSSPESETTNGESGEEAASDSETSKGFWR